MKKVSHAILHQAVFFPGLGNMDKNMHKDTCPGIEMWWTAEGLECKYKGKEFIVPLANVVSCLWAKVEVKPNTVKIAS